MSVVKLVLSMLIFIFQSTLLFLLHYTPSWCPGG